MPHLNQSVTSSHKGVRCSQHFTGAWPAPKDVHAAHMNRDQATASRRDLSVCKNKPVHGFVGQPLLQNRVGVHFDFVGGVPLNPERQPSPVTVALGNAGAGQRVAFVDSIGLNSLRKTAAAQQSRNSQHDGEEGGFVHAGIVSQGGAA